MSNQLNDYNAQMEQQGKDYLDGITTIKGFADFKFHPKQIAFINSKARAKLFGGGMACVHGDTLILNADTLKLTPVKDIRTPIRVFSLSGKKIVKAYTSIPIKFKKAPLYEVKTSKSSFIATANHRVLTPRGYRRVDELATSDRLLSCSQNLRDSISVSYLSASLAGVLYCSQRVVGSLAYCLWYLRSCGQRLLLSPIVFPEFSPSPGGALAHNRRDSYADGSVTRLASISPSLNDDPLSRCYSSDRFEHQPSDGVDYNEEGVFERILHSYPRLARSLTKTFLPLHKVKEWLGNLFSSPNYTPMIGFEQVRYHSTDYFYDFHVFGTNNYYAEGVFHHNSGKTLAFVVNYLLLSQWFPGSNALIGRKTQGNAEETFMKDFAKICPPSLYTHAKGAHKIMFTNGSTAEFWGLDALQSGASDDIKKAEQKLKSHNFQFALVDQLEEIEKKVYDGIHSRMRSSMCTHSQDEKTTMRDPEGNALYEVCNHPGCGKYGFTQFLSTTNPANFWGYQHFKTLPAPNTFLMEASMLDNKQNLSAAFIEGEMNKPERYKAKFLYGQWDDKSMVEGGVFEEEHILNQRSLVKAPIRTDGGTRIFEEPSATDDYQIGVDPSSGATDPCNITCVSKTTGRVVATYTAKVPHAVIAQKAVQIALMYARKSRPLIVPEGNDNTVVELLKPMYEEIYVREVYSAIQDKKTSKLGFYTTHATKTQLIENMKSLFQAGFPKIHDEDTVEEINKFIYTDSAQEKGAGAQKGYHDDRVMGMMLAYWNVPPVHVVDTRTAAMLVQKELFSRNRGRSPMNSTR